jgi:hypothetical protein
MFLKGSKMKVGKLSKTLSFAAVALCSAFLAGGAAADPLFNFEDPLTGWDTSAGNYGVMEADGDVSALPNGGKYGFVTTDGGVGGVDLGLLAGENRSEINGSVARSSVFVAEAGDSLQFFFNYITSDGLDYADYAWVRLINTSINQSILLFTTRSSSQDNTVPGSGMPPIDPNVKLNPDSVTISLGSGVRGGPNWSALGDDSKHCFAGSNGCGTTGWVQADYTFAGDGEYILEFGVVNVGDDYFQSGLAFDSVSLTPHKNPPTVPEPASLALLGLGLMGLGIFRRRR